MCEMSHGAPMRGLVSFWAMSEWEWSACVSTESWILSTQDQPIFSAVYLVCDPSARKPVGLSVGWYRGDQSTGPVPFRLTVYATPFAIVGYRSSTGVLSSLLTRGRVLFSDP